MLTESIAVSSLRPLKIPSHVQNKDVGICFYDLQPSTSLKSTLKKSSTNPNCLVTNRTHAFAAQADKAAVHVYNLNKGNQECLVPFPERITSLALVGENHELGTLVLGTANGNVIFWELATGRQLITQAAHLQGVDCMVVDPTQNFLITGSSDSNVLVWSLRACLSFANTSDSYGKESSQLTPLHTLSEHREAVTCLAAGHSFATSNFVVSGSKDQLCMVWNYRTGQRLHTFRLSFSPLCLSIDPADRAFYVGGSGGSVQLVDFYKRPNLENTILSVTAGETATEVDITDKWPFISAEPADVLTMALSYDGTRLFTGHQDGRLHIWDVATGKVVGEKAAEVLGPLTNIAVQPIKGLKAVKRSQARLTAVVRPKNDNFSSGTADATGLVPESYTLDAQFYQPLAVAQSFKEVSDCLDVECFEDTAMADFHTALSHVSIPPEMLEEEMISLFAQDIGPQARGGTITMPSSEDQKLKKIQEALEESQRSYLSLKGIASRLEDEVQRLRAQEHGHMVKRRVSQERRRKSADLTKSDRSNSSRAAVQEDERMNED